MNFKSLFFSAGVLVAGVCSTQAASRADQLMHDKIILTGIATQIVGGKSQQVTEEACIHAQSIDPQTKELALMTAAMLLKNGNDEQAARIATQVILSSNDACCNDYRAGYIFDKLVENARFKILFQELEKLALSAHNHVKLYAAQTVSRQLSAYRDGDYWLDTPGRLSFETQAFNIMQQVARDLFQSGDEIYKAKARQIFESLGISIAA